MWDDTPFTDGPTSTSNNPTNPAAGLPGPSTLPLDQDEDQDMWDLVEELQAQAKSTKDINPLEGPPAPADDDDWDSMYA